MRLCPASRASCPRPKCPRNHPGPRSTRGKVLILFLPLMGSVLPRSSVAQTPPLGSPKSGPTAKLANFRDAKIRRKAHDESKGGSRARARSRSKARSRAGNPVPVPCRIIVYQWGFCSLATSVAKKPADTVNGLSRHILDRQRAACLRYSTIPLTAPVFFAIFQPTQTLIPLVYDAPARRACFARHSGFVATARQFKGFCSAPLNPWFRFGKIFKYNILFWPIGYGSIFVFIFILCKYLLTLYRIFKIIYPW